MSRLKRVAPGFTVVAALAGVARALSSAETREWIYPLPLIVALVAVVLALLGFIVWQRRRPSVSDQQRADLIFKILSRPVMRQIDRHDFGIPWPHGLLWPIREFGLQSDGPEHRFEAKQMEQARQGLLMTGGALLDAQSKYSYPTNPAAEYGRNFEIAWERRRSGSAGNPHKEQNEMLEAKWAFEDAHKHLIEVAHRRGFKLDALDWPAPRSTWDDRVPLGKSPAPGETGEGGDPLRDQASEGQGKQVS